MTILWVYIWSKKRALIPTVNCYRYVVQRSIAAYLLKRKDLLDENGNSLFHLMNECPFPFYTGYQIRRGSPYRHFANVIAYSRTESGLTQIWHQQAIYYASLVFIHIRSTSHG